MSRGPRDKGRAQRMCALYRGGMTLQEIGTAYGLTRERVRQILAREGLSRTDGGIAGKAARKVEVKAAARLARDNAKTMLRFGCDFATLLRLNEGRRGYAKGTAARAYLQQKRSAEHRGIKWQMSFPEWRAVWEKSGRWDDRGRQANSYVMARVQDFGPYAPWNVYVTTLAANVVDYQRELKKRGVACSDGYKRLPERAELLGVIA